MTVRRTPPRAPARRPLRETLRRALAPTAAAALLAGGLALAAPAPAARAAVPDTIPLTLTNHSGLDQPVYLYDLGTELSTGRQGWADADGVFHPWPGGTIPPSPAPDASIPGPADGASATIRIPKFSGRIYFSYGRKLDFRLTTGGLVQPAVQNPTDPNRDILFNWSEYTLNDGGLWINSTQVDMFSAPYAVGVRRADGTTATTGHLVPGGYQGFFDALRAQPGWGGTIQTRADGTVLRALAPGHAIEAGTLAPTVLDDYIDRVWSRYSTATLTVTPFADRPDLVYRGRVSGDHMDFTDGSGAVVTSFQKPDSDSVLGCYKRLDAPNDLVRGPIARTLCAGFNRTTLLTNPDQPDTSAAGFYADPVTNVYAREVHARMADGRAYAFAFDDVGAHESLVHDGDPQAASMTLDPLADGPAPTPTDSASPTSTSSPTPTASPTPTSSPTPTASPTPTSSPTATSSPTPTPTATSPTPVPVTGGTLYLRSGGQLAATEAASASADTVPSADGANHDGTPYHPLVYEVRNVRGTFRPGSATESRLGVDAGTTVALAPQARVSYDLTGDGTFDRVETYRYFATDPVPGWEEYTGSRSGLLSASGTLGNLDGGTVRVEVWNAIGSGPSTLRVDAGSVLTVPFG